VTTVILCEGYDDRSFLAGWLSRAGATDCFAKRGERKVALRDPWGRELRNGKFLFESPTGRPILIQPCHGISRIQVAAEEYLSNQATRPFSTLIVNLDGDSEAGNANESSLDRIRTIIEKVTGRHPGRSLPFEVDQIKVWPLIWRADDPPNTPGVPNKQTLERLITAALAEVDPEKAASVTRWLKDLPTGSESGKSVAKSYDAKWFTPKFDDIYRAVWSEKAVAEALERRLRECGAEQTVSQIAENAGA
jgi:hypothetical protein